MKFINFNEWKIQRDINESLKDELKCPHPKDKEYCKQWKKWINGELSSPPEYKGKVSTGHKVGYIPHPTKKEVRKRKQIEGEGRYKNAWKRDQ